MKAEAFSTPVFVKRATYIVQEIASFADAIDFLDEWPEDRRDVTHETALRVCYDAYDGRKSLNAARDAFLRFCATRRDTGGSNLGDAMDCRLQIGQSRGLGIDDGKTRCD